MEENKKKILIVDDDSSLCEIYKFALSEGGFEVEVALDGEEGLKLITNNTYDMVLLDIMLPKLNGIDILNKVCTEEFPKKNIRIILLSNLAQESIINKALENGAEEFILKNKILPHELVQKMHKLLDKGGK